MIKNLRQKVIFPFKGKVYNEAPAPDNTLLYRGSLAYTNCVFENGQIATRPGFETLLHTSLRAIKQELFNKNIFLERIDKVFELQNQGFVCIARVHVLCPKENFKKNDDNLLVLNEKQLPTFVTRCFRLSPYFVQQKARNSYLILKDNQTEEKQKAISDNEFCFVANTIFFVREQNTEIEWCNDLAPNIKDQSTDYIPFSYNIQGLVNGENLYITTGHTPVIRATVNAKKISVAYVEDSTAGMKRHELVLIENSEQALELIAKITPSSISSSLRQFLELYPGKMLCLSTLEDSLNLDMIIDLLDPNTKTCLFRCNFLDEYAMGWQDTKTYFLCKKKATEHEYEETFGVEGGQAQTYKKYFITNPEYFWFDQEKHVLSLSEYINKTPEITKINAEKAPLVSNFIKEYPVPIFVPNPKAPNGYSRVWSVYLDKEKMEEDGITIADLFSTYFTAQQDEEPFPIGEQDAGSVLFGDQKVESDYAECYFLYRMLSGQSKSTRLINVRVIEPSQYSLLEQEGYKIGVLDCTADDLLSDKANFVAYQDKDLEDMCRVFRFPAKLVVATQYAPNLLNLTKYKSFFYGTGRILHKGKTEQVLYRSIVPNEFKWIHPEKHMPYYMVIDEYISQPVISVRAYNQFLLLIGNNQVVVWYCDASPVLNEKKDENLYQSAALFGRYVNTLKSGIINDDCIFLINGYLALFNEQGFFIINYNTLSGAPIFVPINLGYDYKHSLYPTFNNNYVMPFIVDEKKGWLLLSGREINNLLCQIEDLNAVFISRLESQVLNNTCPVKSNTTVGVFGMTTSEDLVLYQDTSQIAEPVFFDQVVNATSQTSKQAIQISWSGIANLGDAEERIYRLEYCTPLCGYMYDDTATASLTLSLRPIDQTKYQTEDFTLDNPIDALTLAGEQQYVKPLFFQQGYKPVIKPFPMLCTQVAFVLKGEGQGRLYLYQLIFYGLPTNAYTP